MSHAPVLALPRHPIGSPDGAVPTLAAAPGTNVPERIWPVRSIRVLQVKAETTTPGAMQMKRGDVKKVMIEGETILQRKPATLLTRSETQPRGIELEDASA